jgi:hypothetical protein
MAGLQKLRVYMAQDGLIPQAFRWQGRTLRVLHVETLGLRGSERRFRMRTVEGPYEMAVDIRSGQWAMRRTPGWLDRVRADIQHTPRYPLPAWRRRGRITRAAAKAAVAPQHREAAAVRPAS